MIPEDITWSLETLQLALNLIAVICIVFVMLRAFQQSGWWGAAFVATPAVFFFGGRLVGPLITGIVLIAAHTYFIRKYWTLVGRVYVYLVICWAGSTALSIRSSGWLGRGLTSPQMADVAVQAGGAQPAGATSAVEQYLPVTGGRVWYRVTGTGAGTPVILLHGGPGIGSHHLKPLEALGDDRPVVRYDQLGAGRSTPAVDTALFKVQRFVLELDSLRAALGYERIHLVGHAWGALLAHEYYRANPRSVASLTLASPALNVPAWQRNVRKLVATLPDSMQQTVRMREADRDFDALDYSTVVREFEQRFVSLRPVEEDLDSLTSTMNRAMQSNMWGPSPVTIWGTLRAYDATRRLRLIRVPTLYVVGEFDDADTATVRRFGSLTRGSRVEVIPDAARIIMWDNPDVTIQVIRDFLRAVDADTTSR